MIVASRFGMSAAGNRQLALALLFTLSGFFGIRSAAADVAPMPIPECVGKPDGTFCKLADGTAGQCATQQDTRRPGRTWQSCNKDAHECDRLAIGAECHGYLGKAAHCREFNDPEKKTTWRSCQVDENGAAPTAAAPTAATPTAAATIQAAPTGAPLGPTANEPPPAKKSLFSCSAVPGGATSGGFSLIGLSLLLLAALRRERRAS